MRNEGSNAEPGITTPGMMIGSSLSGRNRPLTEGYSAAWACIYASAAAFPLATASAVV